MRRAFKTIGILALCLIFTWTGLRLAQAITASTAYSRINYQKQHWDITLEAWRSSVISDLRAICTSVTALGTTVANWVTTVQTPVLIETTPIFVNDHQFTLTGDYTAVLPAGKRILADNGQDPAVGNTVLASTYAAPNTTVTLTYNNLTANLQAVSYYATRSGTLTYGSGDVVASEYGSPSWANLQAAVAVANASGRRLLITPGTWPVSDDFEITAPWDRVPTGILQVATTKTLTLYNTPTGLDQAFSCTGTGKVSGLHISYPDWFLTNTTPGSTDMTTAVQSALDSLVAGGSLVFKEGSFYKIDGVGTLNGDGNYYSILSATNALRIVGNGSTLSWSNSADSTTIMLGLQGTNIDIFNLNFDMSGWVTAITTTHLAIFLPGDGAKVHECLFSDSILHAVPIRIDGSDSKVFNCSFYRTAGGVMLVGPNSSITNCYAEDWKDTPFLANGVAAIRCTISNNRGYSINNVSYAFIAVEEGASNWTINGNNCYNQYGYCFQGFYNTAPSYVKGGVISNNIFTCGEGQYAAAIHNVQLSKYYTDTIIQGNRIIGIPGTTNSSGALVIPISNTKVDGNHIESATSVALTALVQFSEAVTNKYLSLTNNFYSISDSITRVVYANAGDISNSLTSRNNTYVDVTAPGIGLDVSGPPLLQTNLEGDDFGILSTPTLGLPIDYPFSTNGAFRWPYSIKGRVSSGRGGLQAYAAAVPAAAQYPNATFYGGDLIRNISLGTGQPTGWGCKTSGTFSSATDNTGDSDGATAVITGMSDTSDFIVGGFVTVSAGFPSASDPYRILAKDATSVTLDTASTSVQSNITVAHVAPTFGIIGTL